MRLGGVGRLHRDRSVERENYCWLAATSVAMADARRDHEQGRGGQVDGRDDMAPKARASRGYRVDQVRIRESDHIGLASALPDEIQDRKHQRHEEEDEPLGGEEREIRREGDHRAAPVVGWDAACRPTARERRRRSRQAASGPLHSWSVRSRRWWPARRSRRTQAWRSATRPGGPGSAVAGVDRPLTAGLDPRDHQQADVRQSSSRPRTLDGDGLPRRPSRASAGLQVSIGAMKSETTIASPPVAGRRRPSMARPRSTCRHER
jgi:hypothetical protein